MLLLEDIPAEMADPGMMTDRPPEPVLLAVTGDPLTGDARGDVSESELSGLATYNPCAPRLLDRAPWGRRGGAGVDGPAGGKPVLTDNRGGPDIGMREVERKRDRCRSELTRELHEMGVANLMTG